MAAVAQSNQRGTPAPSLRLERSLFRQGAKAVAGIDEVGRGCWAGPLVAAAVVLPIEEPALSRRLRGLRDSKQLAPDHRRRLADRVRQVARTIGLGWVDARVIDDIGLTAANRLAMTLAVDALDPEPAALVIDHVSLPDLPHVQRSLARADAICLSVAAASVIAKVARDAWMEELDSSYPLYRFARHKGYGTAEHQAALAESGPCPQHRRSFSPVAALSR